jgi:hypothetical protein
MALDGVENPDLLGETYGIVVSSQRPEAARAVFFNQEVDRVRDCDGLWVHSIRIAQRRSPGTWS